MRKGNLSSICNIQSMSESQRKIVFWFFFVLLSSMVIFFWVRKNQETFHDLRQEQFLGGIEVPESQGVNQSDMEDLERNWQGLKEIKAIIEKTDEQDLSSEDLENLVRPLAK